MLTEVNRIGIGKTVYATMQPVPGLPFPSASMGAEWMGSDSVVLDVKVKSVAKESIVVYEMSGSRDVMNLSEGQALLELSF